MSEDIEKLKDQLINCDILHDFLGGRCPIPRSLIIETVQNVKGGVPFGVNLNDIENDFMAKLPSAKRDTHDNIEREMFMKLLDAGGPYMFIHDSGSMSQQLYNTSGKEILDPSKTLEANSRMNFVTIAGVWDEAKKPTVNRMDVIIKPISSPSPPSLPSPLFLNVLSPGPSSITVYFGYKEFQNPRELFPKQCNFIQFQASDGGLALDYSMLADKSTDMGVKKLCTAISTFVKRYKTADHTQLVDTLYVCGAQLFSPKELAFINSVIYEGKPSLVRSQVLTKFVSMAASVIYGERVSLGVDPGTALVDPRTAAQRFASMCFDIKHSMDSGLVKIADYLKRKDQYQLFLKGYHYNGAYFNGNDQPITPTPSKVALLTIDRLCHVNAKLHGVDMCVFPRQSRRINLFETEIMTPEKQFASYQQSYTNQLVPGVVLSFAHTIAYPKKLKLAPFRVQVTNELDACRTLYTEAVQLVTESFQRLNNSCIGFLNFLKSYSLEIPAALTIEEIEKFKQNPSVYFKQLDFFTKCIKLSTATIPIATAGVEPMSKWEKHQRTVLEGYKNDALALLSNFDQNTTTLLGNLSQLNDAVIAITPDDDDDDNDVVVEQQQHTVVHHAEEEKWREELMQFFATTYASKIVRMSKARAAACTEAIKVMLDHRAELNTIDLHTKAIQDASKFFETMFKSLRIARNFNVYNIKQQIARLEDSIKFGKGREPIRANLPVLMFTDEVLYLGKVFDMDLLKYDLLFDKILGGKVVGGISGCLSLSIDRILIQFENIVYSQRDLRNIQAAIDKATGLLADLCNVFQAAATEVGLVSDKLNNEFNDFENMLALYGKYMPPASDPPELKVTPEPNALLPPYTPVPILGWLRHMFRLPNLPAQTGGGPHLPSDCDCICSIPTWNADDNLFMIEYDEVVYESYATTFNYAKYLDNFKLESESAETMIDIDKLYGIHEQDKVFTRLNHMEFADIHEHNLRLFKSENNKIGIREAQGTKRPPQLELVGPTPATKKRMPNSLNHKMNAPGSPYPAPPASPPGASPPFFGGSPSEPLFFQDSKKSLRSKRHVNPSKQKPQQTLAQHLAVKLQKMVLQRIENEDSTAKKR